VGLEVRPKSTYHTSDTVKESHARLMKTPKDFPVE